MTQLAGRRPSPPLVSVWPDADVIQWTSPDSDVDPWEWLSVGLARDPWFCVAAGIYEVAHGVEGVSYLLRRVATGGPGGEPDVPAGAFAVLDIPSYVPPLDMR